MIRVILFLLVIGAIGFGMMELLKINGTASFIVNGIQYQPSFGVLLIGLIITLIVCLVLWTLFIWLMRLPKRMGEKRRQKKQEKGILALSRGLVAVQSGDPKLAQASAKLAKRYTGDVAATQLLEVQLAEMKGDHIAARDLYGEMLDNPETKLLGYRGLYRQAFKDGEYTLARQIIQEASEFAPQVSWSGQALIQAQTQEGDWAGALQTAQRNVDNRVIDRVSARRIRAVLLVAQAMDLRDQEPKRAKKLALDSYKLAPDLVPAGLLAARLLADEGSITQATKVLKTVWKKSPHPDIADLIAHIRPGDSALDRLKRVKSLVGKKPDIPYGAMALAQAAIDARDWDLARAQIDLFPDEMRSQKVCELIALLEFEQTGDRGLEREWMARALKAPRDAAWVADGYVSNEWAPVSPVSGRLDAFEWKVPVISLDYDADLDTIDMDDDMVIEQAV